MTTPVNSAQTNHTHLLEKSRDLLGWPLIQKALADYTCSPVASKLCRSFIPYSDIESTNNALDTTTEMVELLAGGNSFPINPFDDFLPILKEAKERELIDSLKCLSVLKLLRVIRSVRNCIEK